MKGGGVLRDYTDTPTDSGAPANRSIPHRDPSRGTVGGEFTDPGGVGAEAARGIPHRNPSRGTVGRGYIDPSADKTGGAAHSGVRNSPAMGGMAKKHEADFTTDGISEHLTGDFNDGHLRDGFRIIPMPGAD